MTIHPAGVIAGLVSVEDDEDPAIGAVLAETVGVVFGLEHEAIARLSHGQLSPSP